ncbi:MAG: aldehyde dehydrogenase family protein, partial [Mycobacteriaceae bacterium]
MTVSQGRSALFINGEWVPSVGGAPITMINPSTEESLGEAQVASIQDVDTAIASASKAQIGWAGLSYAERASKLVKLAEALERRAEEMAVTVSAQNGMPIAVSAGLEAGFPPLLLRYYAGLIADKPQSTRRVGLLGGDIDVVKKPMGVVAVIVPWNFPQTLAMMKIAPALAAGNTVVMKPSPETIFDSHLLAEAVIEADLPTGVINIIPGDGGIGQYLISHPGINRVAFTGSTETGRLIAQECGRLLRPVSLELGGKSAAIILDDADLTNSVESLFKATLLNNGQTCFLGTRILAPHSRYAEVVELLGNLADSATIGNAV